MSAPSTDGPFVAQVVTLEFALDCKQYSLARIFHNHFEYTIFLNNILLSNNYLIKPGLLCERTLQRQAIGFYTRRLGTVIFKLDDKQTSSDGGVDCDALPTTHIFI